MYTYYQTLPLHDACSWCSFDERKLTCESHENEKNGCQCSFEQTRGQSGGMGLETNGVGRLPADDRARAIVDLVRREGFQAIEVLAGRFGVTPQTIRRDVNLLCDRGLLRRRHGGVELPPDGENLAYLARQVLNIEAKRLIAQLVAAEVPEGASLFFGIGPTPEQCAQIGR